MNRRKKLGDLLVESRLITDQQLMQALQEQKQSDMKLGDILLAKGYITEQQKIELLELQLGIKQVYLYREKVEEKTIRLLSSELAKKHQAFPLRVQNGKLVVVMADPLDYYALDEIQIYTGMKIVPVIAMKGEISQAIAKYYGLQQSLDEVLVGIPENTAVKDQDENDLSPVVRLVHQMIAQAISSGASDIHIDPQKDLARVRYRVDGMLRREKDYPISMLDVITARLKILGKLNIAEKRLPQDGRFEVEVNHRKVDIRISVLPTIHGEKTVLRILDTDTMSRNLDKIGFSSTNLQLFQRMIANPYGLILITGPTGSGKTTTLYSALNRLNNDQVNIVTLEEPVEYQLNGVNQVQINTSAGLTFARGLRSILRQDPNIIMVGEIRDLETAEMAIRASLTGHLVLSTLHTNDAASTIHRLIDMGIEPYLVVSSLRGIVAQRLVRKICPHCRVEVEPEADLAQLFEQHHMPLKKVFQGKGCGNCNHTGFRGRTAIHEVLLFEEQLRRRIIEQKGFFEDHQLKDMDFTPMIVDGLQKVAMGETTLSELYRISMK